MSLDFPLEKILMELKHLSFNLLKNKLQRGWHGINETVVRSDRVSLMHLNPVNYPSRNAVYTTHRWIWWRKL